MASQRAWSEIPAPVTSIDRYAFFSSCVAHLTAVNDRESAPHPYESSRLLFDVGGLTPAPSVRQPSLASEPHLVSARLECYLCAKPATKRMVANPFTQQSIFHICVQCLTTCGGETFEKSAQGR